MPDYETPHADAVVDEYCTCLWGYDAGHDYCAAPGRDCPIHVITDPFVEQLLKEADERDRAAGRNSC
jgi:hypothetical protein